MKKLLLWIGGAIAVIFLLFVVAVVLIGLNVIPVSRTSIGHDEFGYGGAMPGAPREALELSNRAPTVTKDADASLPAGERVIIRTAWMSIVAEDVQKAVDAIKSYAEGHDGFVVSVEVERDEDAAPSATVSFRIPAETLDAAVTFVRQQGLRVASESVRGEDVTEEYVDVTARLKNLQISESQLQAIMKNATKTEDVLNVHRELERVRGQIESLTGRKKYLEESAKMSSVTVTVATDEASLPVVEPEDQWRPFVVMKAAAAALLDVLEFLVNAVIWVIVFVPIWGTAWLVVRSWRRRRSQNS